MRYVVYVLYLYNREQLYAGFTTDLKRRIYEHQNNKVASTKSLNERPELVFYEVYKSEIDARRRERYLKSSKGKQVLSQMLSETLKNIRRGA